MESFYSMEENTITLQKFWIQTVLKAQDDLKVINNFLADENSFKSEEKSKG